LTIGPPTWATTMTQLKSLAHPDWPYAGTAHEWRGFVRKGVLDSLTAEQHKAIAQMDPGPTKMCGVYQKQNFGPELP
jgi:hypothetical protein